MASSLEELKSMTDEQLIEKHDSLAGYTSVGINYYLAEMRHREQSKVADRMELLTRRIWWLTVVVTLSTILNLGVAVLTLVH